MNLQLRRDNVFDMVIFLPGFTRAAVGELGQSNPHFASGLGNYLQAMPRGHF